MKIGQDSTEIFKCLLKFNQIAHFELIQATLVAKFAIVCHFESIWCEMIQKSWKTQKFADVPPKMKSVRFLQKWDTVVVKDGKSCESGD